MRAVVYERYGPPEVLQLRELEKPAPQPDELLIRVRAVEATKADCEMRSFRFPVQWFWLPLRIALGVRRPKRPVLGSYFAGEVEAVGAEVTKFAAGDAIFGCGQLRLGAYAEYMCLPESFTLAPKPTNMSFAEAAAVPLGGLNALHFLRLAEIQPGERVLVNGAGGSIGTFGVQIAKAMGAHVTAVDSGIKEAMLQDIGADAFIDYTQQDFAAGGPSYDVILDMVASSSYANCVGALKPGGRYLMANPRLADMLRSVLTNRTSDKRATFAFASEKLEELQALRQMIEAGQIRSAIDKILPLEQAAAAHRRVETEQRVGIVVLAIDSVDSIDSPQENADAQTETPDDS